MNKKIKYISLISLMLFSALSASACFADGTAEDSIYSRVKIENIQLKKTSDNNVIIIYMGKQEDGFYRYNMSFVSTDLACDHPAAVFTYKDKEGKDQIVKIARQAENRSELGGGKVAWKLNIDVASIENLPLNYVINYKINPNGSCPSLQGSLPELLEAKIDTEASTDGNTYVYVTNVSSKVIEIEDVVHRDREKAKITVDGSEAKKTINHGEKSRIKLSPNPDSCKDGEGNSDKNGKLSIEILYKEGGATEISKSKYKIEVTYSCNWAKEKESAKSARDADIVNAYKILNAKYDELYSEVSKLNLSSTREQIDAVTRRIEEAEKSNEIIDAQKILANDSQFKVLKKQLECFLTARVDPESPLGQCYSKCDGEAAERL